MPSRHPSDRERDLERELASHLEAEADEHRAAGLGERDALAAARRALGNPALVKEDVRAVWGWTSLDRLRQDLRFAWRSLWRTPAFTLFALLTLALGLGANAGVFRLVDAVLLHPLPFRDASRLVALWEDGSRIGFPRNTPAPANVADWQRLNHVFSGLAALKGDLYALTGAGAPEQIEGSPVSANLFPLLGLSPILGRNFTSAEDGPGGARVAIIAYRLWRDRFASSPRAVGAPIWLNSEKFTIVGVMPPDIEFPENCQVWIPLGFGPADWAVRDSHFLRVVARLKPGVSLQQARAEMSAIAARLARRFPDTNSNVGAVVVPLREQLAGNLRFTLWASLAGVACVLLIASANLAGLMLARSSSRAREFAVRAALGASRARLIRQILAESLLLAFMGAAAGALLAAWIPPLLSALAPSALAPWPLPPFDPALAVFLLLASLLTVLVSGLLPAWSATTGDPAAPLHHGGRSSTASRLPLRRALIVAEVALSLLLTVAAGLLARSVWQLAHVPLGFQPAGVMTLRTALPVTPSSPYRDFAARTSFYARVLDRVSAIPGVLSAGYTTFLPLTNGGGASTIVVEGAPPPAPGQLSDANHRSVSDRYLQTIGVPLIAGRFFLPSDGPNSPRVAIVNQAMARLYWPGQNPIGRRFRLDEDASPWFRIVGVVANVRQMELDLEGRPEMYFPSTQPEGAEGFFTPRDLAVRVTGDPASYAPALQRAVWQVDRQQPIASLEPLSALINARLAWREMAVKLIAAFAALALLAAALGVYALLAYTVAQRRREIGVRIAIGARPQQVLASILGEGLSLVAWGATLGAAASLVLMRALGALLYGVSPRDPATLAAAALVIALAGALASFLPARRAASIDPVIALRDE